tara:strand:+ start:398 stop:616 length:219 start_codon:yes stop_codon:yes gene_type:complete
MSKKGVLKKALGLLSHYSELGGRVSVIIPIDKKKLNHYRKLTKQLKDIIISYQSDLEVFHIEIEKFQKYIRK